MNLSTAFSTVATVTACAAMALVVSRPQPQPAVHPQTAPDIGRYQVVTQNPGAFVVLDTATGAARGYVVADGLVNGWTETKVTTFPPRKNPYDLSDIPAAPK